jgi:hypothetical protein
MKESPRTKKLEEVLRSSKLVSGGFLGGDQRSIHEIIDSDLAEVSRSGVTTGEIAARMQAITEKATQGLGCQVAIDKQRRAHVDEAKGSLVCPWPHPGRFAKRVTTLMNSETGRMVRWSDLNIHMIEQHGFFEGRGSPFRLEPGELIRMLF